ncbi:MAG TPA: acyl-CoA thioesterase [Anaeromyxobacteraceae bacterium]|nr:acyl-CoA thioesterase [Anaeromyxobacteraceae bacterium]
MPYSRTFALRWSDADANGHVRHTVYPELGVEVRMAWLAEGGFDWKRFEEARLGPVLLREEIDYLSEVSLGESVSVDLEALAVSPDGGRWKLRHTVRKVDGEVAARVVVLGGWLDLERRRLAPAPELLARILSSADRAEGFEQLPPLRRRD